MNKDIKDLNIKAKRKLYYLKRTYGLIDIFTIKTEFKNEKEEREYLSKLKEFLFSSKYKYIRGGKIISCRKSDYGKYYFYPINREQWKQIKKLINVYNKKHRERFPNVKREEITFNYQLKTLLRSLERKTKIKNKSKIIFYGRSRHYGCEILEKSIRGLK